VDQQVSIRNRFEVTLSEIEVKFIEAVVQTKVAYDAEGGKAKNLKVGERTPQRMLNAAGAELAFGKLFNLYVDFSRRYRWYDVMLPDGRTVDIKTTTQDQGHLICDAGVVQKRIPDLFALVVGEFPTFEFRGVIAGDIFIQEVNKRDFGHGACYAVEQNKLCLEL
jgi:hypothetical protein